MKRAGITILENLCVYKIESAVRQWLCRKNEIWYGFQNNHVVGWDVERGEGLCRWLLMEGREIAG